MNSKKTVPRVKPIASSAITIGTRLRLLERLGLNVLNADDSLEDLLARLNVIMMAELGHATAGPMYLGLTRAERIVLTAVCGHPNPSSSRQQGKSYFHKLFLEVQDRPIHRPKSFILIDELSTVSEATWQGRRTVRWRGKKFNFKRKWWHEQQKDGWKNGSYFRGNHDVGGSLSDRPYADGRLE